MLLLLLKLSSSIWRPRSHSLSLVSTFLECAQFAIFPASHYSQSTCRATLRRRQLFRNIHHVPLPRKWVDIEAENRIGLCPPKRASEAHRRMFPLFIPPDGDLLNIRYCVKSAVCDNLKTHGDIKAQMHCGPYREKRETVRSVDALLRECKTQPEPVLTRTSCSLYSQWDFHKK
jgi:hypothetical protein